MLDPPYSQPYVQSPVVQLDGPLKERGSVLCRAIYSAWLRIGLNLNT